MRLSFSTRRQRAWVIVLLAVIFAGVLTALLRRKPPVPGASSGLLTPPPESLSPVVAPGTVASPVPKDASSAASRAGMGPGDRLRPLPVAREGKSYQWTVGDGRSDEVIGRIAHNLDEYRRMVEENDRIKDRQLVYCKVTAADLVDRARARGATVQQMALPGMNGQEYQFEIKQSDLAPSGQKGTLTGQLAGKGQSTVTLAYKFGREAFSVLSPEDNLYLEGEAYEPGAMVVKSIDPAVYTPSRYGDDDFIPQNTPAPPGK